MIIRNIERADLEDCAALYADVFSSFPWNESWTTQVAIDRLAHFYESKGFSGVLAEDNGLRGFALGNIEPFHTGNLFYLREMCVANVHQSQGVGSQIYKGLEGNLRLREVDEVYLATEREIPAAKFYFSIVFKCAEEVGFYTKSINS